MSIIVAVEGADRVGKATLTKNLKNDLNKHDISTISLEVPVNDRITYPIIYWMLRNKSAKTLPNVFQFVQFLNKFFFQFLILFISIFYDVILLDRWKLSSDVYGKVFGASPAFTFILSLFLMNADKTFIVGDKTYSRNEEQDVYEKDTDLQKEVKKLYRKHSLRNNHIFLDNNCSQEELLNDAASKIFFGIY
jgi:thymidylate kinase